MARKPKVGKDSSKGRPAFLGAKRKIGGQIERVWKDFFEKNPDIEEEDVRRRLEERLKRKKQELKGLDEGPTISPHFISGLLPR